MAHYTIETKPAFSILAIGTQLKAGFQDYAAIEAAKNVFWQAVNQDGRLAKLRAIASDSDLFIVNEAVDGKMMYYIAVRSKQTLPEATRRIEFPAGEYVVVPGTANSEKALADTVTNTAFTQVLGQIPNYAYVGGPNAAVISKTAAQTATGAMLIPVVKK
ncbi:GyrI-like domain-containing protein [Liquorilactobacillus satsumensis]|uniref:Integron-associated effector binding protein domain-containing protein n=2 Tax=Liquorilactobacillus satsumensis TaxID=259059 RepID=A0A0R1V0T7_9LACO|nr:GyrI-like domain-containing protein [Liquorilactobacillus satsumensis]KRL99102.1 hypothetical protein FD50_GL000381 [Liquorilactobacillus satsumensis DSM 16230 = JCM 12392]MCC7666651.1 transcriptional regulator [Liquorilactobacillus satsumensis]MCP9312817.1 effector binding domain-containing protein [Liquorilactobacillus satsumensis]MCP9329226.1 effector binding domain-containing protein [Liquorilactobacillus satsumensis]MCP9357787.1 effector binding domain-containing protein [Liquorilactob